MKSLGVRQAKAHLSALVRAATSGECSLVTDNGRLVAMIGPPPQALVEAEDSSPAPTEEPKPVRRREVPRGAPGRSLPPRTRLLTDRKEHEHLAAGHSSLQHTRDAEG
jgi:antitoxin (DNA-binding transcriptional repressor) of toxin-antitoxin stability system